MKKRFIPAIILMVYSAILVKVMVFKDIPPLRIGGLMLNFGGPDAGRPANFIPFKTILPYLLGYKGLIIAGINLVGNIALLVPVGFLAPLVYRSMTWKKSLALAVVAGLAIEVTQVVLRVGIFDIDDVILNGLGVMIGYFVFVFFTKSARFMKPKNAIIITVLAIAAIAFAFYAIAADLNNQPPARFKQGAGVGQPEHLKSQEGEIPESDDLCSGTGGVGQIVSVENNTLIIKRKDGRRQKIHLTSRATVKSSAGLASVSDLKTEDRVTLVGGSNADGSFTADTVVVCYVKTPVSQ